MARSNTTELVFLPLGGVGEIGMNLAMYGFGPADNREWLVVDMGVSFAGPEQPGADLILPDIRYLEAEKHNLRGIVITHAHEDHFGALLDLWPHLKVPVYATPFTAGLLEAKRQSEDGAPDIPITIYKAGEKFEVGPFKIEAVAVTHSIPEPVSLALTTPLGTVVHTGDWKMDPEPSLGPVIDEARFRAIGDAGVLALICDSTNALREGESPSERQVGESLRELIENARGRVAITTFSSNVGRIRSITEAARDAGRQVLVVGRSMKRAISVATELGYMEGLPEYLSEEDYGYIPRENVVMILTGSQGEPRAALAKLARDEMRSLALTAGDTVIYSSRAIPGNERPFSISRTALSIAASRSSATRMHWSMCPAIHAAANCAACIPGFARKFWCRCTARQRILSRKARLARWKASSRSRRCAMATCCVWRRARPRSSMKRRLAASTRTAS